MAQNVHHWDAIDSDYEFDMEMDTGNDLLTAPMKDRLKIHVISSATSDLERNLSHGQSATSTTGSWAASTGNNVSSLRYPIPSNMPDDSSEDPTSKLIREQDEVIAAMYENTMRISEEAKKDMNSSPSPPFPPVSIMEYDPFARRHVTRRFPSELCDDIDDGYGFDFIKQMELFATKQQEWRSMTRARETARKQQHQSIQLQSSTSEPAASSSLLDEAMATTTATSLHDLLAPLEELQIDIDEF
ncbi:unnamed protein product [Orchesella dallaii]|uniref:Uncharacterized protein n=1 Tax=Orchesella dallaii TaxID=48710 RepID=A0ABP1QGM2_9HEXA